MSRLTEQRVEKWYDRIDRAYRTLENVRREVSAHAITAKGGRLSDLQRLHVQLRVAGEHVDLTNRSTSLLLDGEQRRKHVRRVAS